MTGWMPGVAALGAGLVLTPLVRRLARGTGAVSDPDRLRYYSGRRPLLGGMMVAVAFWLGVLWLIQSEGGLEGDRVYSPEASWAMLHALFWATFFLVLSTSAADLRNHTGYYEWLYVLGSAVFISCNNIQIESLSVPLLGTIELGWGKILVTVIWIVIVVSMVEVLESFGGLVTNIPLLAACAYFFFRARGGEVLVPALAVAFIGSLVGFLPWHWGKNGILLGKAGNKVVGFLFAAITIVARHKATTTEFLLIPFAVIVLYVALNNVVELERRVGLR